MKENEIRPADVFDEYLRLSTEDIAALFADSSAFVPVPCPACGEEGFTPAFEKHGFRYVVCTSCASLYANPRPDPEALAAYYRNGKAPQYWDEVFFRSTAVARRERIFLPRRLRIEELLGEVSREDGMRGTLADIGAGFGVFLDVMSESGRFDEIVGIEPNPHLARTCRERGFRIVERAVEDLASGEVQADVATCFEVVEHVFDPLSFLHACRAVLRPAGLLFLTTLTISGFDLQVLWDRAKAVHPPHHLNFISIDGFRRLCNRVGLEPVRMLTPGKLDLDIVRNWSRENPAEALPRFVQALLDSPEETQQDFQAFLQRHRLSSHFWLIARVPAAG